MPLSKLLRGVGKARAVSSVGGMSSSSSILRFLLLWDTPLAFIALVFSKHGHKVDICKDCGYHTVAGRLEKHVCTKNIERPLEMLPNEKHKELRSGKNCNKWRKGYVMYADFESTLEPERCPVPLHLGSMVAFKPAVAFT